MSKRIVCTLPGHEGDWIEWVGRITVGDYNRWRAALSDETQQMIVQLVADWNVRGMDGENITGKPTQENLDKLPLLMLSWLIRSVHTAIGDSMSLDPQP